MLKPNIFLLIIDSFRSDKCYGPDKTSKTLNPLRKKFKEKYLASRQKTLQNRQKDAVL